MVQIRRTKVDGRMDQSPMKHSTEGRVDAAAPVSLAATSILVRHRRKRGADRGCQAGVVWADEYEVESFNALRALVCLCYLGCGFGGGFGFRCGLGFPDRRGIGATGEYIAHSSRRADRSARGSPHRSTAIRSAQRRTFWLHAMPGYLPDHIVRNGRADGQSGIGIGGL